jgi:hypothetical protein
MLRHNNSVNKIQVLPFGHNDPEVLESWESVGEEAEEPKVRAIRVSDESFPWQIFVENAKAVFTGVMGAKREIAITNALETVVGIEYVEREELGLWVVSGDVKGRDLVIAVFEAIQASSVDTPTA